MRTEVTYHKDINTNVCVPKSGHPNMQSAEGKDGANTHDVLSPTALVLPCCRGKLEGRLHNQQSLPNPGGSSSLSDSLSI